MIRPPYLKNGSRVGIVSPAGAIGPQHIKRAKALLQSEGFGVEVAPHATARHHRFAGTDAQRLADLQAMLDDPGLDAILCSRGGYGTIRVAGGLRLDGLMKHPKWLIGYSDITILHAMINQAGMESIHGPMALNFPEKGTKSQSYTDLLAMLRGENLSYELSPHKLSRPGKAQGQLTGGNLTVLAGLALTGWFPDMRGRILFIEDVDERPYRIDRLMQGLRAGGHLAGLAGLVVGTFSQMQDDDPPFGRGVEQIIADAVEGYSYPVCFGFPAGHDGPNRPLVMGAMAQLSVDGDGGKLGF